ncbi:TonB family protein [Luteimonas sp. R10]|uniref:TonB family protein n=1 Tax=Luteimonas sp. R10 TaxID=3108176 RepID=UPI00309304D0|nr:TonB family protein [Luteimonas sp. R10]
MQPLDSALDRFATVTGRSVLYNSDLVAGRTASPVHGRYASLDALRYLLEGTGLTVEEARTGQVTALVLKLADEESLAAAARLQAGMNDFGDGLRQGIWEAICADARTAGDDYRALMRLAVDATGRVRDVRLLDSTGNAERDEAITEVVGRLRTDLPPPGMPQPLAVLIRPGQPGEPACRSPRERP